MILVTGAAGFVGQHLVKALLARYPEERVRAFDLRATDFPAGVEAAQGSIEDSAQVERAAHGARVVVHLAAFVEPNGRAFDKMWRVNVEGTRNVRSAAVSQGAEHFIHLSSAGIYGHPRAPNPFVENDAPRPTTAYQRTKWEAEGALRQSDSKSTIVNIIRPAGIYGAGSYLELDNYRRIAASRWAVEFTGGVVVHPTHVQDVVEALLAVIAEPAPHGSVFNLGGERAIRLQDLDALVAERLGIRRRRITVGPLVAGAIMSIADPLLGLLGRRNALRKGIGEGKLYSSAVDDSVFRARYPQVATMKLTDGLAEHLAWAQGLGLIQMGARQ